MRDYAHFGEINGAKCPLHDNIEDRHEKEVKKAAEEAMAKVRAENPAVSTADLMIKVSDRVRQAGTVRQQQVAGGAGGMDARYIPHFIPHGPPPMALPPHLRWPHGGPPRPPVPQGVQQAQQVQAPQPPQPLFNFNFGAPPPYVPPPNLGYMPLFPPPAPAQVGLPFPLQNLLLPGNHAPFQYGFQQQHQGMNDLCQRCFIHHPPDQACQM